jgi:hypothetical protein
VFLKGDIATSVRCLKASFSFKRNTESQREFRPQAILLAMTLLSHGLASFDEPDGLAKMATFMSCQLEVADAEDDYLRSN